MLKIQIIVIFRNEFYHISHGQKKGKIAFIVQIYFKNFKDGYFTSVLFI